jgi:anti-sigma-K factor RskA
MSDPRTTGRHDDETPLAAEYVLGVLSAAERRDFERRLAAEPTLRSEVEFWEARLGELAAAVEEVAPPPRIWARIESELGARARPASDRTSLWHNLAFWRFATFGSSAIAAACLGAFIYLGLALPGDRPLVARLELAGGGQAGFVAAVDPSRNGLTIVPASATSPPQRALELWVIVPGDKPRSLGLIDASKPVHINLPADLTNRVAVDAALAVTIEPPGGSPRGAPTGPVIASGKLTNL